MFINCNIPVLFFAVYMQLECMHLYSQCNRRTYKNYALLRRRRWWWMMNRNCGYCDCYAQCCCAAAETAIYCQPWNVSMIRDAIFIDT